MNLLDYQKDAQRTKSPDFHGHLVPRASFLSKLIHAIAVLNELDAMKKTLFYGKPFHYELHEVELSCMALQIHALGSTPQRGFDILHSILGSATEAGESLEALLSAVRDGKPFDYVNFVEETGDDFWYKAIGFEAVGVTFEYVAGINNKKLRTRFPQKFSSAEAVTRDLDAERKTLEGTSGTNGLTGPESPGEMLERVGTDADKWAKEFIANTMNNHDAVTGSPLANSVDHVRAWFANAIETARLAGYTEAKRT